MSDAMEVVEDATKKRAQPDTGRDEEEENGKSAKRAKTASDLFREQVEYYFSVANYPTDKWMNVTASENNGCAPNFKKINDVPITSFSNFPRLAKLLEGKDNQFVIDSLSSSDEVEFNEEKTAVKRKNPVPSDFNLDALTVFVSKLPQSAKELTIDSLRDFFNQFAPTLSVKLHKSRSKADTPAGTAYVTFKSVEDQKKVLAIPEIKWGDQVLKVKDKAEADAAFQEKKHDRKKGGKKEEGEEEDKKKEDSAPTWQKGLILKLSQFASSNRETLSNLFSPFGTVKFIDIKGLQHHDKKNEEKDDDGEEAAEDKKENESATTEKEAPVAYIRFASGEDAAKAAEAVANKEVKIEATALEGALIGGDEEEVYWVTNIINAAPSGRGRKRGGHGGRGRGKGRGRR